PTMAHSYKKNGGESTASVVSWEGTPPRVGGGSPTPYIPRRAWGAAQLPTLPGTLSSWPGRGSVAQRKNRPGKRAAGERVGSHQGVCVAILIRRPYHSLQDLPLAGDALPAAVLLRRKRARLSGTVGARARLDLRRHGVRREQRVGELHGGPRDRQPRRGTRRRSRAPAALLVRLRRAAHRRDGFVESVRAATAASGLRGRVSVAAA